MTGWNIVLLRGAAMEGGFSYYSPTFDRKTTGFVNGSGTLQGPMPHCDFEQVTKMPAGITVNTTFNLSSASEFRIFG